ncbi:MAG: hypothetical protein LBI43_02210 [Streptococcaceae bacterium]|jgi:hypothetical protein|nr:hypothetical protein [Streptococcaceae bacterium]
MNEVLKAIWQWLENNPHPLTDLRTLVWFVFLVLIVGAWLAARRRSRKRTAEDEQEMIDENFQKNEDGLYPWEVNTNDHPSTVKKGTKPHPMDNLPQRGRWRI